GLQDESEASGNDVGFAGPSEWLWDILLLGFAFEILRSRSEARYWHGLGVAVAARFDDGACHVNFREKLVRLQRFCQVAISSRCHALCDIPLARVARQQHEVNVFAQQLLAD